MLERWLTVLLMMALWVPVSAQSDPQLETCKSRLQTLAQQLQAYREAHGSYPTDLEQLQQESLPACPVTTVPYRATLEPESFKLMCLGKAHPGLTSTESDVAYSSEEGLIHPYDGPPLTESAQAQFKRVTVERRKKEFYERYGLYLYSVMGLALVFVIAMFVRDRRAEDRL